MRYLTRLDGLTYKEPIVVVEGSTKPLVFFIERSFRYGIDLTGATVTFSLIRTNQWLGETFHTETADTSTAGRVKKVDGAACTLVTVAQGKVQWAPGASDLNTPGYYLYQFKVVESGGKIFYAPDEVEVMGRLRVTPSLFS